MIFEDARQSRDFVHVSDIVQANLLVMEHDEAAYGVFNVASGRAVTILDVAEVLIEQMGLAVEPEIVQKFRAGDIRHCVADIGRISTLGYQPRVRFADGMAALIGWVRTQSAADSFEGAARAGRAWSSRLT